MESTRQLGVPLDLAGPVNFRDVGGYRTEDGLVVRRGRLYRSDGLWALSEADLAHLMDEIGVRTIVDLRTPMEIERYGPGLLANSGVTMHNISFFDESLRPDIPSEGSWTLDDMYVFLLRRAGERITSVLTILSSADVQPAVFHCTAGKDRTGIVAGLLLGLLGVSDDDIADDYASTAEYMPLFTERAAGFLEELGREAPAFSSHVLTADREIMLRFLTVIRDDAGSLEEWVLSNGMAPAALKSLRTNLLERP